VSGRVVEILFQAGDAVARGAALVRLDDDIERADLAEAEALLREKELALERARTLRSTAAVSQATIDQLVAERATAQARVDRAARRLADRVVAAPFAGTVGLRRVDVGARVDDDTVLTTLDDLDAMEVAFALPERLFGQIAPGQAVRARSAAFPDRVFTGAIETLDSRIDAGTRSFAVRAILPNPDRALPAGMFMHLELVVASRMALVVPEEAVVVTGDRAFVFAVADGRAMRTEVELGQREVGRVEIVRGLEAGVLVVVEGVQRVRDGVPVEVEAPPAEGAPVAAAARPEAGA
jgi:membrane fusion protein (multidrug efflux system)